jgi:DhnA family fructose-bisphosphate aldolase class Ia
MMNLGKMRRMRKFFHADGRTMIVAMDHGAYFGLQAGLENPLRAIEAVVTGGADAVMTTVGIAQAFASALAPTSLILRVDGGATKMGTKAWRGALINDAETALKLGADGVVVMGFPGAENEDKNLQYLAALSKQCLNWGLPLMAEMLPRGFEGGDDARAPDSIALAARVGAELGVDIVKTQYTGSIESFRKTIDNCFVPVVVLGGPKSEDDAGTLRTVREALDAGARGVAMGRNIWGHARACQMTRAVVALVHEDVTVERAVEILNR